MILFWNSHLEKRAKRIFYENWAPFIPIVRLYYAMLFDLEKDLIANESYRDFKSICTIWTRSKSLLFLKTRYMQIKKIYKVNVKSMTLILTKCILYECCLLMFCCELSNIKVNMLRIICNTNLKRVTYLQATSVCKTYIRINF